MRRTRPTSTADGATELRTVIEAACNRVAPAWPLDRSIAVNPYWGWIDRPIAEAAAGIGAVSGSTLTMGREWYREHDSSGRLSDAVIERALARTEVPLTVADVRAALAKDAPIPARFPLLTEVRDVMRTGRPSVTCREVLLAQVNRVAETFVDGGEADWSPDRSRGLYPLWCSMASADRSPRLLAGVMQLGAAVGALPTDATALIAHALDTLPVPVRLRETYLTALLYSVSGWASVAAQRRWEARLAGADDQMLVDLLAIRLAWELAVFHGEDGTTLALRWTHARALWQESAQSLQDAQVVDWVLQEAVESRYHEQLAQALGQQRVPIAWPTAPAAFSTTRVQAVFCIDVRSEPLRRALEDVDREVRTLGFAGFFGLPITYVASDGAARAQLPGLLSPAWQVRDVGEQADAPERRTNTRNPELAIWRNFMRGAPSTFAAVESTGIAAAASLLHDTFGPSPDQFHRSTPDPIAPPSMRPMLVADVHGEPVALAERAALAAGILRGMSLTAGFARIVAFIGHGATLTNNPQAAALACGACGGHSGEVNARAAASLLNDAAVREALPALGITIPAETLFVAGLHDTTTDVIELFADTAVPAGHVDEWRLLKRSLTVAATRCRAERAKALGLAELNAPELREAVAIRAASWAEVRPEWGLARNGVFIAAPRARTIELDLRGRAFLHEYVWQRDPKFAVLESILTAPMIVAHWINLQYYASVVDPELFGSGDKTLHNVAGGNVGVYEGAGGDLRVGLALQSVHDGEKWQHEPLRLGVYIEAPTLAIDRVIEKHEVVRHLVEHGWLHLYAIGTDRANVRLRRRNRWELMT